MIISHLSDLHISRYGIRQTNLQHGRLQLAEGSDWTPYRQDCGWRIDFRRALGRARLYDSFRLIDAHNCVHRTIKVRGTLTKRTAVDTLQRLQDLRVQSSCAHLAINFPPLKKALQRLALDPTNGNLRFCVLSHVLGVHNPDWLVITGDLTDDGEGYELIQKGFAPFIETNRLLCIPGNHDIYSTPAVWHSADFLKTTAEKKQLWKKFSTTLGTTRSNRLIRDLGEGVLMACFDSCYPSKIPYSASGLIPPEQIEEIAELLKRQDPKALRIGAMHHPIVKTGLTTYLPGMRLRNAKNISKQLKKLRFDLVLCGHQHLGYHSQPEIGPVALSAPSTTFGCRTGAKPFYWLINVASSTVQSVRRIPLPHLASAY
jgi:3',5'-cyclic AMP phosphodiesterase CpdA